MTPRDSFRAWTGARVQGRNPYPAARRRDPDEALRASMLASVERVLVTSPPPLPWWRRLLRRLLLWRS